MSRQPLQLADLTKPHEASTSVPPDPAESQHRTVTGRPPKPVRSTLDLPPDRHAAFQRWAVDASEQLGRKVQGQHVLRALVARLLDHPEFASIILDELRNSGQ